MNQLFGAQSPLMMAVKKIIDVLLVNLLWIITSIPVVTLGVSTAACYDVVYKDIWHGRGNAFFDFFHALRTNLRQGLPVGILFTGFAGLMGLDIWLLHRLAELGSPWGDLWVLVLIFLAFGAVYFLWISAYLARFQMRLPEMALNTLKLCITHVPVVLLVGILSGGSVLAVWLWPGTLFFLPTVAMLGGSMLLERVFRRYMTPEERQREDERNHSWRLYRKKTTRERETPAV